MNGGGKGQRIDIIFLIAICVRHYLFTKYTFSYFFLIANLANKFHSCFMDAAVEANEKVNDLSTDSNLSPFSSTEHTASPMARQRKFASSVLLFLIN